MEPDQQRANRAEQRSLLQFEGELAELRREFSGQIDLLSDTVLIHETALDRVNAMADGHCRGPNVPLTPFHGNRNEDFAQYIKQFELICTANNYAADKRAQILGSYLHDKAFFIYDSLPVATKGNYDLLKAALNDKFQTADHRRYAHQKFQGRKQLPTENVQDYACDVHRMGLAALADIDTDQRDALIREKLIAGLLPHLRELIVYSNPTSFHEAMTLAERLEGLQAAKTDTAAKNVLLLENISDRLTSLEVNTREVDTSPKSRGIAYVMDAPEERNGNGLQIQRKFNLGNYRQEFRPRGMVCFRCNRTGHMARNCMQNRNMSTVVCRLCNRMGHYARDCQRRGAALGRRTQPTTYNRQASRNRIPTGPPRPNRAMVVTAPQMEPDAFGGDAREFVQWKPLIATMWSDKPKHCCLTSKSTIVELDNGSQCVPSAQDINSEESSEESAIESEVEEAALVKVSESTDHSPLVTNSTQGKTAIHFVMASVKQAALVIQRGMASLICCWILCLVSSTLATNGDNLYRHSEPMLCQAFEGKALWKLPTTFSCPEGNHSIANEVTPIAFRLYKRNYIQYKSEAWKCVRLTEEVETFSYFFGDENLKKAKRYAEAVSAEDCVRMRNYKMCRNEPMIFQGGIYQTNNKLDWSYPGGGINCCHWKKFTVTNCFMYTSHVYKRHGSSEMESTAGKVSDCKYKSGQCVLSDGSFLLWDVKNESFCEVLPWKTIKGKMSGTSWLSDDSNLALTFTKEWRTADCQGIALLLSDQGIPVKPLNSSRIWRRKRELSVRDFKRLRKIVKGGGIVSSAQLAASLQAMEIRWGQNMQFAFSHALNNVCNFMRSVIELLKTQVLANPTMAIRALTNQTDVFARSGGNVIEVFPCTQLNHFHYQFKPMNDTCSVQLPIKFHVNNKTATGYLDPVTNIIHRFSVTTDCGLVKQVPIQLRDKTFVYHAKTGEITPVHDIPEMKVQQWNVEPVIDMKATIFHEIVIYNWKELQTHISLNDIIGSLDRQRTILQHIGITDQEGSPQEAAENAVSRIMNKGYFGFLHGLTANLLQVWTFLVCLYVTICVLIVHCIPMQAIPAALNAGNAARKVKQIWQNRRRQNIHLNRAEDLGPQSRSPSRADEARLSQLTSALLEKLGRRSVKAIMPPSDIEMTTPTAPLVEESSYPPVTYRRSPRSSTANVQPFRINVIYPVSETAIPVMVEGLAVECLLDTGASYTVMSMQLAKLLGLSINDSDKTLTSVTGHEIKIEGMVQITTKIAGLRIKGNALVAQQLPYEIIIRVEFMKQLGDIKINFQNRTVHINEITIDMQPTVIRTDAPFPPPKQITDRVKKQC